MRASPLRRFGVRIAEVQSRTGVPYESVLRDHALSYLLAGIYTVDGLAEHAVFKGGTALRKCYFTDYRYSEDLDFSTRDLHTWTTTELTELIDAACMAAQELAEVIGAPYTFTARAEKHRTDRTDMQHNFRVTVVFPTGATLPIKFELTQIEPIVTPVEMRVLLHAFEGEMLEVALPTYSLNEVVLEKLRAFLQTAATLDRGNWTNRSRDLYDLWWLWNQNVPVLWNQLRQPLAAKAAARDVTFSGPEDFLDSRVLRAYLDGWDIRLTNVVPALPAFDDALLALRNVLARLCDGITAPRKPGLIGGGSGGARGLLRRTPAEHHRRRGPRQSTAVFCVQFEANDVVEIAYRSDPFLHEPLRRASLKPPRLSTRTAAIALSG